MTGPLRLVDLSADEPRIGPEAPGVIVNAFRAG